LHGSNNSLLDIESGAPFAGVSESENAGLTQAELAEKLNVSRAYICDIEHGRREISKQFAKQLADFFKISIARLI
jgi:transcriptional regulator with XRE-family HTH domain